MALVQRTIRKCDVCGHEWIPRGSGDRCGNRKCRSTKWNAAANTANTANTTNTLAENQGVQGVHEKVWAKYEPAPTTRPPGKPPVRVHPKLVPVKSVKYAPGDDDPLADPLERHIEYETSVKVVSGPARKGN